mmetsp:Transcript_7864/g.19280  ORF Transcript_7864/g.19280 Transcript_7864/m.19280 type:complete len:559 (+) Transcript_7864:217-1893(+)
MSLQASGRRRAVGNRSATSAVNSNNSIGLGTVNNNNNNKSCKHGCDCSSNKYHGNKGTYVNALFQRILPFAIVLYGGVVFFRLGSLPQTLKSSAIYSKHKDTVGNCELREYPKRRYYGLEKPLPDFLDTEYIYGRLPRLVNPTEIMKNSPSMTKLCVDQSEWYNPKKEHVHDKESTTTKAALPFADGTNPSILKLVENPRIDASVREILGSSITGEPYYLATICMTDSQCSWNDSPQEIADFFLSTQQKPSTVRTVLLVLSKEFETLMEATIRTRMDAPFGRIKKASNNMRTFQLDDARLFTHKGLIWVSYREGKLFGYDKQVLNKLHFEFQDKNSGADKTALRNANNGKELTVTLLASDTETLCCGRNMALIDNVHTNELQALTWVDPVTVVDVDVSKTDNAVEQTQRRLLKDTKKKSHFHGTNGFMVHLPKSGEYLGIGHFHRPPGRDKNEYARFGHHYTHAFFTITDQPPFHLKRLSAELVLSSHTYPEDAEIIQFWSGLELSKGNSGEEVLALAYGINDCEGAALHLDLAFVDGLLETVPQGKEVVDFMMPLKH